MGKRLKNRIKSATYMTTILDFENPGELGVFINTVPLGAQPAGQNTYNPNFPDYLMAAASPNAVAEYSSPGQLLVLEYIDKLTRAETIRQQFEFVIQF